jgi:hypothetical protein
VLDSREWITGELVEFAQLLVESIIGEHRPAQSVDEFVERDELLSAVNWDELGDRMAVDGDAKPLARLYTPQEAGGVVAEFALRHIRSHLATS